MWQALMTRLRLRPAPVSPARSAPRAVAAADLRQDVPTPAAAPQPGIVVGARRPLVDTDGALAGFEFHVSPLLIQRLRREGEHPAARAVVGGVLGAMRSSLAPGRMALAELPAGWLAATTEDSDFSAGMWLISGADADAGQVDRLRRLGVRVGWRPAELPEGVKPDFLLVPAAQATHPAGGGPDVPLLVLDAPDIDTMESLLHAPVALVACNPTAASEPARVMALSPQVQRLMSLLARLVRDEDHGAVVADIKADAALALRLLQYMNSAGATPGRVLDSIDDAVRVLGRDALYRWCSQLLVRLGPSRPAASALQALALARARLCEQLAQFNGKAAPGRLYLLGLASLLPELLHSSVADALAGLQLPAEARLALCEGAGPWAPYLALARALEQADLKAAEPLAADFGGLPRVMAASARCWA
jgi:hypothetical protein